MEEETELQRGQDWQLHDDATILPVRNRFGLVKKTEFCFGSRICGTLRSWTILDIKGNSMSQTR